MRHPSSDIPLSKFVGHPLEVPRALDLALALASALGDLHRRGVIHQDLKPGNILVTPAGDTRLIDFGSVTLQLVEHGEAASLLESSLAYMSPEQTGRMNRSVDHRTDLYSLGVTLYELLTGARPFHGRDALEWFHAHMAQVPQPPRERVPDLPPVLSSIVLKLLAKVAEERYQSAEGLRADLERCRDNLRRGVHEDFPLGAHDYSTHFQLPQQMYGRSTEAAVLHRAFERVAREGRCELLLIGGYSGVGKSALVHELHRPVVRRGGFFLTGKFEQFRHDIPFATLSQAVRGLAQQLLASPDEELAQWSARLNEAWQGQGQVLVDVVPALELVAGPQPAVPELPPPETRHRLLRAFLRFLGVFATAAHPLVLFLDDLQWADLASLHLLQLLLTHWRTPPLLLVGAWRDNEVGPDHDLTRTLEELREAGARMTELRLGPLSTADVRRYVADALPGAGEGLVAPLAALAHEKTGGNPFFLRQLLRTLHQEGLLSRTSEGTWRWDAEAIRARGYSDNVVDFMVGELRQLPPATQYRLWLAACVGNAFSREMLELLSLTDEPGQVPRDLEPALREGLLTRTSPGEYRFPHDRVQQAAYALIPEQERQSVHLHIGRLLLERLPADVLQERLFEVVGHLNAGAELIHEPEERLRVARLNARAGRKAQAATAFHCSTAYLTRAFALLPGEDPWAADPTLAFRIQLDRATCALMHGQASETYRLLEELLPRAGTREELVAVYRLKGDILMASGEFSAAVDCLVACLIQMGEPLSPRPTWEEAAAASDEVLALLRERSPARVLELPLVEDPDMEGLMGVYGALMGPAYFTDSHLFIVSLSRSVGLSIRHGLTGAVAPCYLWYVHVLSLFFKRHREAWALEPVGRALLERHDFVHFQSKTLYIQALLNDWTRPMASTLELLRRSVQHALQSSHLSTAGFCHMQLAWVRLLSGHALEEVEQECAGSLAFLHQVSFPDARSVVHHVRRFVRQLRGEGTFGTLSGEDFDEATFEAGLGRPHMSTMQCWYWVLKMRARYHAGAWDEACAAGDRAEVLAWSSLCHIQRLDLHLFHALALAASPARLVPEARADTLKTVRAHHQQLAEWAGHQPETFRAPERMVFAELARLEDREGEALRAYEEAQEWAREQGFVQHVALACELAARCWHGRKLAGLGDSYLHRARDAWARWGAHGKVAHLEDQWEALGETPRPPGASLSASPLRSGEKGFARIDVLTVLKAQQAISGEIVLERLADTLLRAAIENAGAQRGALLLPRGDQLAVVSVVSLGGPAGGQDGAAAEELRLPWTLITYTRRTREHVLLGDVSHPHGFSADPWLRRGGARSVLCLPLLRQEELRGVLYLENGLVTNAFTPARLALLGHLASQAAISLENARLYADVQRAEAALRGANDELELRVEERTHELKQAQDRLVGVARTVGMAEMAAGVMHNVGNSLTSVVSSLQMMDEVLTTSRVDRLKPLSGLLAEHGEGLADFLTRDERGQHLPAYVSALGDELLREQKKLREGTATMGQHLKQIRNTLHVLQDYAHAPLFTEECELDLLVEDAVNRQLRSLQRRSIVVTRRLTPVPRVRLDKYKVLAILSHLVSNAKHALAGVPEERRRLHVWLRVEGERALIQVVDSGVGFALEVREHLFRQGYTTREGGHGLGLHLCALTAKQLGGTLSLESDGPGQGATATLELPLG